MAHLAIGHEAFQFSGKVERQTKLDEIAALIDWQAAGHRSAFARALSGHQR
jgi:hypothetical protein